ncbi:hypothetical protein L0U85_20065, partial [Glycomyces sp. L485]|uniref:hypothetical protein n=1 Tax=Glycomyces sp. L485 TaxID=2909235 RepID=UPI001F4AD35D
MSDNIEFKTEDYAGNANLDNSELIQGQQNTADASFLGGDPCTNSDCQNTATEAEGAWVKLVSAIPVAGQAAYLKCVAIGTAAPSQEEVQNMVGQVRPSDPDNYALRTVSQRWMEFYQQFSKNPETSVAPILRTKLGELANGWQGDDFDGFAEQMETVFANCEQIAADIGDGTSGMSGLLEQKASEIFALQGS